MNPDALKLLASRVVNKIGNVFFDYGNNAWMAAQGALGKQFLGIYQITDLLTSILLNSFGGVLADRFERRRVLLWFALPVCGSLCHR